MISPGGASVSEQGGAIPPAQPGDQPGVMEARVVDAPADEVKEIWVTVTRVTAHSDSAGWVEVIGQDGKTTVYRDSSPSPVQPRPDQTRRLDCIDCHTSRDIMGDGYAYRNMYLQGEIGCTDCHGTSTAPPRETGWTPTARPLG